MSDARNRDVCQEPGPRLSKGGSIAREPRDARIVPVETKGASLANFSHLVLYMLAVAMPQLPPRAPWVWPGAPGKWTRAWRTGSERLHRVSPNVRIDLESALEDPGSGPALQRWEERCRAAVLAASDDHRAEELALAARTRTTAASFLSYGQVHAARSSGRLADALESGRDFSRFRNLRPFEGERARGARQLAIAGQYVGHLEAFDARRKRDLEIEALRTALGLIAAIFASLESGHSVAGADGEDHDITSSAEPTDEIELSPRETRAGPRDEQDGDPPDPRSPSLTGEAHRPRIPARGLSLSSRHVAAAGSLHDGARRG